MGIEPIEAGLANQGSRHAALSPLLIKVIVIKIWPYWAVFMLKTLIL
jgi:hypothetical protein